MLKFDDNGLLVYENSCKACSLFPNPDPSEQCLMCGTTQLEIFSIENKVESMNRAWLDFGVDETDEDALPVYRASLHLSDIHLSSHEFDTMTFSDIDMNDDIRKLAELTDYMVELVIMPTNIKHKDVMEDDYMGGDD